MAQVVNENKKNKSKGAESAQMLYGLIRFIQLFSFIYSFVSFCYWAILTLDISVPLWIRFFFEMPYNLVQLLGYKPSASETDFTGAILGSVFLGIGFFTNYIADSMEQVIKVEEAKQKKKQIKKNVTTTYSAPLPTVPTSTSSTDSMDIAKKKFVFLMEVKISEVDISVRSVHADSEKLKKRICDAIIDNLNMNKLDQCGFYKKNLFIVYKDFDYIDSFIYYIKVTLDSLAKEFASPQLMIDFNVTFSIISSLSQLENELILMDMILTLNMMNEFVSTAKFKSAYEGRERTKYVLVTKGTYNLSRNLSINNNQDLFTIRERRL